MLFQKYKEKTRSHFLYSQRHKIKHNKQPSEKYIANQSVQPDIVTADTVDQDQIE